MHLMNEKKMEIYNYEEDSVYYVNPFLPKGMTYHSSYKLYSIYHHNRNDKLFVDITGKKHPTPRSYFWEMSSMKEVTEFIDLIANPVRD